MQYYKGAIVNLYNILKLRSLVFLFSLHTILATPLTYNPQNLGGWAISVDLLIYIHKILPEGSTILELGSGTGTGELAKYYHMHSIEHAKDWVDRYNSEYIFAPIKNYDNYKWYDIDYLFNKLPEHYDLILVDGPPGPIGRYGFLHNLSLFNCNVPIIFDDTQRKAEITLCIDTAKTLNRPYKFIKCSDGKSFGVIIP